MRELYNYSIVATTVAAVAVAVTVTVYHYSPMLLLCSHQTLNYFEQQQQQQRTAQILRDLLRLWFSGIISRKRFG